MPGVRDAGREEGKGDYKGLAGGVCGDGTVLHFDCDSGFPNLPM